ncbi:MAG TPA: nucleotidyltransferase family protein [Candidatus Limnocylindrales bacterium]
MSGSAAGLILAAGAATRFGADKLSALLDGRPLLQHVVDAAVAVPLRPVTVVVGDIERHVDWHGARPLRNPDPGRGLSSSLRIGLDELAADPALDRVVVLLGDQPRVSAAVIRRLLEPLDRPIVVPRYADGAPGNPVVLGRACWPLAAAIGGDRGMSQLFATRPDLVTYVDVAGSNPDIDTPADLAALERATGDQLN